MPLKKLREFLNKNKVKYVAVSHSQAYTAQEIAASAHISGKELAKTVMIAVDGKMAMAVLPASSQIDFKLLGKAVGSKKVKLADEDDFGDLFGECEVGAMPPFGNLYELDVYVDDELAQDEEIAFNAGSHTELIRMKYADFERLVQPKVAKFAARA